MKKSYFDTCPYCKAHLDPGERCDCEDAQPVLEKTESEKEQTST